MEGGVEGWRGSAWERKALWSGAEVAEVGDDWVADGLESDHVKYE